MAHWLPLFPLRVVLFPGTELTLRIFEPRYKALLEDCTRDDVPFGIVYAQEEDGDDRVHMAAVGCTAHIMDVTPYEDGTFIIRIIGGERFRIKDLDRKSKPYLVAATDPVLEVPDVRPDDPIFRTIEALLDVYRDLLEEVDPSMVAEMGELTSEVDLSYLPFDQMVLPDDKRQKALELRSMRQRCDLGVSMLRVEIETLRFLLGDVDEEAAVGRLN
jgi:Lon protease-like protein